MTESAALAPEMQRLLDCYPIRQVSVLADDMPRTVAYREGGNPNGVPLLLLHGIGAGAAAWLPLFPLLSAYRVLAWDAPGYGDSSPVDDPSPVAADYAAVLQAWMAALQIERATVVGHSLGAVMAGAAVSAFGLSATSDVSRIAALQLISPAAGYGAAPAGVREQKLQTRLSLLDTLGVEGMARERSAALCGPSASDASRAWVRWNMARVHTHGYRQAGHLLANADLAADLAANLAEHIMRRVDADADVALRLAIAVGSEDQVTTPAACAALAHAAGVSLTKMPGLGHACYMESPQRLSMLIADFVEDAITAEIRPLP